MPATTKKVEDLYLNEVIQTSSDYNSGFGIDIDDESRSISIDIGDLKTIFIQRVDDGCYASYESGIAKGTQTSALTPNAIAHGYKSVAGGYALKIISGDLNTNTMKFRTELSNYRELLDEYASLNGKVSYKLEWNYTQKVQIQSIDYENNTMKFISIPVPTNIADGYNETSKTFYLRNPAQLQYTMWFPQKGSKFSVIGDIPLGQNSIALGYECLTFADECHAEGSQTIAQGRYAHAEGYMTNAGYSAHAEGTSTEALGHYSHSEGHDTHAYSDLAHVAGWRARATHERSWVWQGYKPPNPNEPPYGFYNSKGIGTFCINPVDGISGVWIGDKSLSKIIDDKIEGKLGDINAMLDDILS